MRNLFYAFMFNLFFVLQAGAQVLVFTAIPDEDESKLQERFGPMSEYLSKTLDIEVRYVPVKSYAAAVSAFRNDQVQLAWFGALSGVQARATVPNSQALAQGEEDQAHHDQGRLRIARDAVGGRGAADEDARRGGLQTEQQG